MAVPRGEAAKGDFARADGDPPASARIQCNLANPFEAPVFAWIGAIVLVITAQITIWDIGAAWLFLAGRLIHTTVQCSGDVFTINFLALLWLMTRAFLTVLDAA